MKKLDDSKPIYVQVKEYIEDLILAEIIKEDERVPSTNELAKFYKINPATARQGMNELVNEQVLRIKRGVGMFVTKEAREILIEKRKRQFIHNYVKPLKKEARKLNITSEQLIELIKEDE